MVIEKPEFETSIGLVDRNVWLLHSFHTWCIAVKSGFQSFVETEPPDWEHFNEIFMECP